MFARGRRAELTASPKVYFVDCGVRNLLTGDFSAPGARADRGALFENWLFGELTKLLVEPADIHYWRTRAGAEVDFVLHRGGLPPVGIEAKLDGRAPRVGRGARSFIEACRPAAFITVAPEGEGEAEVAGVRCRWCRPEELPAVLPERFTRLPSAGR